MSADKPSLPKGTRDFGPEIMVRRNLIFDQIRSTFTKFGFQPLETPSMENLSVLTGKYGDEGDQLIFKILNSGNFLDKVAEADIALGYKPMTRKISEKALRYDLTVPFARYVVMNKGQLTFPFKRYQIQPVWRADRPQKGRYREFYQCDADVVGSDSLLFEAEIILMIDEVLTSLGLTDFTIKINNRKLLTAMSILANAPGEEGKLAIAIDKLDKIGIEGVRKELLEGGFSEETCNAIEAIIAQKPSLDNLEALQSTFGTTAEGAKGLEETATLLSYLKGFGYNYNKVELDLSLARGLSYYTGTIFEVKVNNVQMGSISGGGRYDNLTGLFGLPGVSGVGFSFGVDRIYDVMDELNLFQNLDKPSVQVMIANFGTATLPHCLQALKQLRDAGISSELYPEEVKMKKQFSYADDKQIPYVIIIGSEEAEKEVAKLKNMVTGEQLEMNINEIVGKLK
jgi:histidyl-tRNA synthetase